MKRLLAFLFVIPSLAFSQVAFDVSIQQVNSAGTGFDERLVSPAANSLLGFGSGKLVGNVTVGPSLSLSSGTLSVATGGVTNAMLANPSLTLGSTALTLGTTTTSVAGLSSVAATTFTGALTGNASTATALATGRTISITGDLAYSSAAFDGTGPVTGAGTLATVNSNVGTFGSATQSLTATVNAKGLVTGMSAQTVTPAVGSLTGLGTGVATFLATPTFANLNAAVSDADLARTDAANSFSGTQTFGGTISVTGTNSLSWQGGTNLTVSRRSNGRGNTWATTDANDYTFSLFRNSVPSAGAGISALEFEGLDAGGSSVAYAQFAVSAPTVTAGASSGQVDFGIQKAGTFTPQWKYAPSLSRFYNSYTSESIFESLDLDWNANIARIGTNQGGGGTARDLQLGVGGAYYWQLSAATGALFPTTTNVTDIGTASPSKMIRTMYVGTRVVLGNATSEAGFIHARDTNGTMVQLNSDLTTAATAVNTGAWKSANWGFSANSGGASFLGGYLSVGNLAAVISNAKLQASGPSDPRIVVKATDASTAGLFFVPNNNANLGWTVRATASATPALEFFSEAPLTALSLNYSTGAVKLGGSTYQSAGALVTDSSGNVTVSTSAPDTTYGSATAQAAAVSNVAQVTVGASDSSYIVSCNALVTASTTHSFSVECAYTDEGNTARVATFNVQQLNGTLIQTITNVTGTGPYEGVPLHIRCKAGTTVTIRTASGGTYTSVTYNLRGAIEQIN
jgi:hypothetical protein